MDVAKAPHGVELHRHPRRRAEVHGLDHVSDNAIGITGGVLASSPTSAGVGCLARSWRIFAPAVEVSKVRAWRLSMTPQEVKPVMRCHPAYAAEPDPNGTCTSVPAGCGWEGGWEGLSTRV